MTRRRLILGAPVLASALLSLGLVFAAWGGWKGRANRCIEEDGCYCEAFQPGSVRQPANTWSCLAFVAAGLLCAAHAVRREDPRGSRLASTVFHPALCATAIALMIGRAHV